VSAGEKIPYATAHAFQDAYLAFVGIAVFGLLLVITLKRPQTVNSAASRAAADKSSILA
jgi:hypothetical protein